MLKILQMADQHIREKDVDEAEKCLNFIIETAKKEAVNLIVSAGDFFDSQDIKLDSRSARLAIQTVSALADIAPVAIIIGTSSHDGKSPEILRYAKGVHPIEVAAMPVQLPPFYFPTVDAIITLIPQPNKQHFRTSSGVSDSDQEISTALSGLFAGFGIQAEGSGLPHIMVYHGSISGAKLSNGQTMTGIDIEVSLEQMMFARPQLILLGHIHKNQKLGDRAFYPGSIYHQNWGEMEPKGFYIHEINKLGHILDSRFIETPAKKLTRFSYDFTEGGPVDICLDDIKGSYVRLDYKVWQDEAAQVDRESITAVMKAAGALDVDIRIVRIPRQNVRSEAVLKADSLRDKIKKMAELKEEQVAESILVKAEYLENMSADELIEYGGLTS